MNVSIWNWMKISDNENWPVPNTTTWCFVESAFFCGKSWNVRKKWNHIFFQIFFEIEKLYWLSLFESHDKNEIFCFEIKSTMLSVMWNHLQGWTWGDVRRQKQSLHTQFPDSYKLRTFTTKKKTTWFIPLTFYDIIEIICYPEISLKISTKLEYWMNFENRFWSGQNQFMNY